MQHPGGHGGGAGHGAKHSRHKKHVHGKGKHHPKHQHQGHHQHQKQHVHTVATHPHHRRGLAIGDFLPVCSLEAVAQWLRLESGARITDDDVAGLWEMHGELSIPDAAEAFGLSVRPAQGHSGLLLLGVDLPGPHAVLATPDGWWSWGSLWSPWTSAVSEAWAVSWL